MEGAIQRGRGGEGGRGRGGGEKRAEGAMEGEFTQRSM